MTQPAEALGEWTRRAAVWLEEVDSTQNEARRLAEAGAPEGTVVRAEHQTRGRGRFGRTWLDEPGAALLVSVVLRPGLSVSRLPQLSLVAGVAVAEAIETESGLPVELLWPNDLLIRSRKVAGILAESFVGRDAGPVVILGIGINVNHTRFPGELTGRATSLALEAGRAFDRERLLETLLDGLAAWYRRWLTAGFGPVREAWRRPGTLGRRVPAGEGEDGVALDLAEDGALLVRTDSGAVIRKVAGDWAEGGADAPGH